MLVLGLFKVGDQLLTRLIREKHACQAALDSSARYLPPMALSSSSEVYSLSQAKRCQGAVLRKIVRSSFCPIGEYLHTAS